MPAFSSRCRTTLLLTLVSTSAALQGCLRPCEFKPHCEGNTVMECEYGIDQVVGAGEPRVYPCLDPAPVCVERREGTYTHDQFFCARSPVTPCESSFADTCEGETIHVFCAGGYVAAEDCSNQAGLGRCFASGGFVRCG